MELNEREKLAVRELGHAINTAIEQSPTVAEAIEHLRSIGFESNLHISLEVSLQEIAHFEPLEFPEDDDELDLTEDDLRTLERMKIKI